MVTLERWREAQATEPDFYAGMALEVDATLDILYHNSLKARDLSGHLKETPRVSVEIGPGPYGVGISGYLTNIPVRICVEPDPRLKMDASAPLGRLIEEWRKAVHYVVGVGESIPVATASADLVICCNVIDHAYDADKFLAEIARILKPGGLFFFDVDTFSLLGLVKWNLWTKHRHKDELLVIAHTYRMFEPDVVRRLKAAGLTVLSKRGHTLLSMCVGHARNAKFLLRKPLNAGPQNPQ
jgi:SAM-dependent methyltransferase